MSLHPWDEVDTDLPQPGEVSDLDCGIEDKFDTSPEPPEEDNSDDDDGLNVYDEADDDFEDEEDES